MSRLDKYLFEQHLSPSREKAKDAVLQGMVTVNGDIVTKPSYLVNDHDQVEVIDIFNRYVSRGGLKLEKAIVDFGLDFKDKKVLDVGASTGGFTDCALKHGASHCYCVDVGSEQLHPLLRNNPKVTYQEKKDFRDLTPEEVGNLLFDFIVVDASFISLTYLLPYFEPFLSPDGYLLLLIKPQFEAGQSFLNKRGVVSHEKGYQYAIQKVVKNALTHHYHLNALSISTLFEQNKNIEFLALFSRNKNSFILNEKQLMINIKNTKKTI